MSILPDGGKNQRKCAMILWECVCSPESGLCKNDNKVICEIVLHINIHEGKHQVLGINPYSLTANPSWQTKQTIQTDVSENAGRDRAAEITGASLSPGLIPLGINPRGKTFRARKVLRDKCKQRVSNKQENLMKQKQEERWQQERKTGTQETRELACEEGPTGV